MLHVDDIREVERLVSGPLEKGGRISLDHFLGLLEMVRKATPGRGHEVCFLGRDPRNPGKRASSRSFCLEHITPVEVVDKVGGEGLHLLGQALAGRYAAAWAFRRQAAPGRWDVFEVDPVRGRVRVEMRVFDERDGNDTFAMCSPLMAHSTLAYIWAGVRELQLEIQG